MLLEKKVGNVLFEFEPWAEKEAALQSGAAKDYIQSMGYRLYNTKGQLWDQADKRDTMIWAMPARK